VSWGWFADPESGIAGYDVALTTAAGSPQPPPVASTADWARVRGGGLTMTSVPSLDTDGDVSVTTPARAVSGVNLTSAVVAPGPLRGDGLAPVLAVAAAADVAYEQLQQAEAKARDAWRIKHLFSGQMYCVANDLRSCARPWCR
jgi:hypothetical protein